MLCACVVDKCAARTAHTLGGYKFSCLVAVCIVFELEFMEMDEMVHNAHSRQYLSLHCYCRSMFMQRFLESGVVEVATARHRIQIVLVDRLFALCDDCPESRCGICLRKCSNFYIF